MQRTENSMEKQVPPSLDRPFPIVFSDVFGDANIGVFSYANEKLAVLPAGTSRKKLAQYRETLQVEAYNLNIAESRLVGVYLAGNSNGVLVPHITAETEQERLLSTGIDVHVLTEKYTALGNLIVCNDYGAIVDPRFKPNIVQEIEEHLKVPVVKASIAGLPHVGALTVATNHGAIISPLSNEVERKTFSVGLGVRVEVGTVNGGVPFPKAGVVANSRGAVVGGLTMGRELVTVSNVFQG